MSSIQARSYLTHLCINSTGPLRTKVNHKNPRKINANVIRS